MICRTNSQYNQLTLPTTLLTLLLLLFLFLFHLCPLGDELETKSAFMTEEGLVPLIELVSHRDDEVSGTAVYALVRLQPPFLPPLATTTSLKLLPPPLTTHSHPPTTHPHPFPSRHPLPSHLSSGLSLRARGREGPHRGPQRHPPRGQTAQRRQRGGQAGRGVLPGDHLRGRGVPRRSVQGGGLPGHRVSGTPFFTKLPSYPTLSYPC